MLFFTHKDLPLEAQKQIKTMLLVRKAWQKTPPSEHFFNQAKPPKPVLLTIAFKSLPIKWWLLLMPEKMMNEVLEQTTKLSLTSASRQNWRN